MPGRLDKAVKAQVAKFIRGEEPHTPVAVGFNRKVVTVHLDAEEPTLAPVCAPAASNRHGRGSACCA